MAKAKAKAKRPSNCLLLSLLFLLLLLIIICSSATGTLVGFLYDARGETAATSTGRSRTISFLQLNKVSSSQTQIRVFTADHTHRVLSTMCHSAVSVDLLHLNESVVENLRSSHSSAVSWLKTHLLSLLPHVDIKSIVVATIDNGFRVPGRHTQSLKQLSTLKSIHSLLTSFNLHRQVKVSVAFSSSFLILPKMKSTRYQRELHKIFGFIRNTGSSYVIVDGEAIIDGDHQFVKSAIAAASVAASTLLPWDNVPILITIKSPIVRVRRATQVSEFIVQVEKSLQNNIVITNGIAALYAQISVSISALEEFFVQKQVVEGKQQEQLQLQEHMLVSSGRGSRQLLSSVKTTAHDSVFPPTTTFPTSPVSIPTPTIVTVPSTNPVTITPANPADTPPTIPTTTPVTVPSTNPNNPTVPITNPVTMPAPVAVPGAQPVTNPVTTYPAPTGGVPVSTPVTNPVTVPPPPTTNAPAIPGPGQSWCVARTGALETSLQAALDYACGMGGADCLQIQQGANCYNPNTLQNHASYAFNSYYQKNLAPTSCDFGGTATIVNTNPSSGSCIYPSSASQSTPSTVTPATTSSTSGTGVAGSGSVAPASVLNSSTPGLGSGGSGSGTTVFGSDAPPGVNTPTTSKSAALKPFSLILLTSFVAALIFLHLLL